LPPFLHDNPTACERIKRYCTEHLDGLTVELVHEYIHDVLLPSMLIDESDDEYDEGGEVADEVAGEDVEEEAEASTAPPGTNANARYISKEDMLRYYCLQTLCTGTVYKWMITLGMKYDVRKKNYYVDTHERDVATIFVDVYTIKLKRQVLRTNY